MVEKPTYGEERPKQKHTIMRESNHTQREFKAVVAGSRSFNQQ